MRTQSRPAERLRHCRGCIPNKQRPLQGQCHHFGNSAHASLDVFGLTKLARKLIDCAIKIIIAAAAFFKFSHQCSDHLGLATDCTQHIEPHHVARPFPDGIHRGFAVEPGHDAVLDITRTPVTLHGFEDQIGATAGIPVLGDCRAEARNRGLMGVIRVIHCACDP